MAIYQIIAVHPKSAWNVPATEPNYIIGTVISTRLQGSVDKNVGSDPRVGWQNAWGVKVLNSNSRIGQVPISIYGCKLKLLFR